ncbi:MAG: RNA methyltransferase [Gemmatimonadetes bacterium]|nr:RNA methyltransferase [Gemmatimonadota bacterium]MBT4608454.1 RNA methyltransferase [Gemmatimonadota bacterium]MBT5055967.1 RNA methyltransferase [Gemmatimonadota bacterium]MBT5143271.1 RNA methyltransferase [Gemmatimonadota bacterium]MBT5586795.1 RNA methyltransferase [Gemmatimonadota bacterium]
MARREISGEEESGFEVRSQDLDVELEQYRQWPKFPLWLVLDNLRSAFNVGAFYRLADIARLSGLVTCGYTAHPPHPRLDKTALGTLDFVDDEHVPSTLDAITALKDRGIKVWAVETTSASKSYTNVTYPRPLALVFGNEALGIDRQVLDLCDGLIEIPVFGYKNSLNVASAAAVVSYEILRQWNYDPSNSEAATDP